MDCDLQSVALERIDTTDRTFQITTPSDKPELTPSIRSVGLLQPPILLPKEESWIVVGGFRRITACAALHIPRIPAWLLGADCSMAACVRIAIADNAGQRPLNVVEQARALSLICSAVDETEAPKIAEATGMAVSQKAMARILPLAAMARPLQEGVLSGKVALPVALRIHAMRGEDARELTAFFLTITAGLNVQRELIERIVDVSKRDRVSIAELIRQDAVEAIVNTADTPMPQKVQQLRRYFKEKRYPELSHRENRYQALIKSLQLHPRLHLQPPPFFEGKTYQLSLSIESREQLKTLQADLDRLIEHPHILPE